MKRWIERVLNVQPGDLGRGALLCTCLFLVISSYVIGKVAGAALFLSRFQAKQLAYADISSSILVALVVAGYVLVARRVSLKVCCSVACYFSPVTVPCSGCFPTTTSTWSGCFPSLRLGKNLWRAGADPDLDSGKLCSYHAGSKDEFLEWWAEELSRVGFSRATFLKPSPRPSARKVCCWEWHCSS